MAPGDTADDRDAADGDREVAERIAALGDVSFEEALRELWRRRPQVPPRLVERFVGADLIGGQRAAEVADQIEAVAGPLGGDTVVEVGAGTAALGVEVAARCAHVVVTDVSLAWLVLARRRLAEAGHRNVSVVACPGEVLPFLDGSVDVVLGADVIEHVPDAAAFARSCLRVLRPGGRLWLSTPNRLSPTPEPHVRLWGVGLLPRRLALAYVRRARGVDYEDIHTLTLWSLRRALAGTGATVAIMAPPIAGAVRSGYPPVARAAIGVYNRLARNRWARRPLVAVSPLFHAVAVRDPPAPPPGAGAVPGP
jgi:SAM-dependent methyltransferase